MIQANLDLRNEKDYPKDRGKLRKNKNPVWFGTSGHEEHINQRIVKYMDALRFGVKS